MEHLTVYLIILGYGLFVTSVGLAASILVSVFVAAALSRCFAALSDRYVLLAATCVVPFAMLALMALAIFHIFSPDFRGPEGLGVIIYAVGSFFMLVAGWPLSYYTTRRLVSHRPMGPN